MTDGHGSSLACPEPNQFIYVYPAPLDV